jgi:thiamine biosynthesis lipoprotein
VGGVLRVAAELRHVALVTAVALRRVARAAAASLGLALASCTHAPLQDGTYAMGTLFEVTLEGAERARLEALRDAIFAEVARLESQLSTWSADSDVSRLNRAAGTAQAVDPAVAELLALSRRYSAATRGSFDVTVGPLVALWTHAAELGAPPSQAEIAAARARVGAQRLRVGPGTRAELPAGMALDLGGVAKGFALDRVLPLVRDAGVDALLSFGQSSTLAVGAPRGSPDGWRLLARAPAGGFDGVITLRDRALSVSGSLGQFREIAGRRYGHVIDPRSGLPLERDREALVVAPDATLAEALSKALLVLGEREGIEVVAAQPGCEGLLLDAGGGRHATPGWHAATRYERLAPP